MLKKLLIVYNPRSSKAKAVEQEVLAPARKLKGWLVGKYQVKATDVDDNAKELAKILNDGDLVISAGGDGTAVIATNGVMLSGKDVTLGVLGYGNFNDMARMLGMRRAVEYGGEYVGGVTEIVQRFVEGKTKEIYPLEVKVNGEHWRYAPCYVTVGLLAEASVVMNSAKVRKWLKAGKKRALYSLFIAVKWYLKNKKRRFLPAGVKWNGMELPEGATDFLAVNSPRMAKLMKSKKWYLRRGEFGSGVKCLGRFWRMVGFGLWSVGFRLRLRRVRKGVLEFAESSEVEIQAEGEGQRLKGVKKIVVEKSKVLKVVGK